MLSKYATFFEKSEKVIRPFQEVIIVQSINGFGFRGTIPHNLYNNIKNWQEKGNNVMLIELDKSYRRNQWRK